MLHQNYMPDPEDEFPSEEMEQGDFPTSELNLEDEGGDPGQPGININPK
ncbi:MAG: hypothetical protein HKN48_02205 [Flavobacteriaceae bacterium]|nr:hypothetical protein [Flavobacteriaceae bacterium]